MRVITDTTTSVRTVEVLISKEEIAARLGYTGLHVCSFHEEHDGTILIALQNGKEAANDLDIGQEREVKSRMYASVDRECDPRLDTESDIEVALRYGHEVEDFGEHT